MVAPVSQPREGYVVYRDSRRAAAGRRLDRTLAALREAGIPAHGGVFDDEPLAAVKDVLASEDVDEIIVSTHPETKSGWLRKNLVEEIRKVAGERPVEHVVADDAPTFGRKRPRRRERDRARRAAPRPHPRPCAGGDGELPHRVPAERSDASASTRRRSGASARRSRRFAPRGSTSHGQIAHPDPFTAAMQEVHDERTDEIIVSTFPGERSGWLRRDLVGRLRSESGLPVEHVVVEPASTEARA